MDPKVYSTLDGLKSELSITKRKLESKCEALLILRKELDTCQQERDQFKMMAEQVQERYQALRKSLALGEAKMALVDEKRTKLTAQQLHSLLHESREANKTLQFELEEVKSKLLEAQGDIKLLRGQLTRQRVGAQEESGIATRHFPAHEREELVKKLEDSNCKFSQLERDLEQCLDEKEELVSERDVFKSKYERLNSELNYILKGDEKKIVDIDALVMENKFLNEKLKQIEEEKSMAMATVTKYKTIIERKKSKNPFAFGHPKSGSVVITEKQVRELLTTSDSLPVTPKTFSELQNLTKALLETVNDKNLALSHQRKTNKILGNRISELEMKLKTLEVAGLWNIDGSATLERLKTECVVVKEDILRDSFTPDDARRSESGDENELHLLENEDHLDLSSMADQPGNKCKSGSLSHNASIDSSSCLSDDLLQHLDDVEESPSKKSHSFDLLSEHSPPPSLLISHADTGPDSEPPIHITSDHPEVASSTAATLASNNVASLSIEDSGQQLSSSLVNLASSSAIMAEYDLKEEPR